MPPFGLDRCLTRDRPARTPAAHRRQSAAPAAPSAHAAWPPARASACSPPWSSWRCGLSGGGAPRVRRAERSALPGGWRRLAAARSAIRGRSAGSRRPATPASAELARSACRCSAAAARGREVALHLRRRPRGATRISRCASCARPAERATFFVVGKSINASPGCLSRELELAALGDHTYTHPDLLGSGPHRSTPS